MSIKQVSNKKVFFVAGELSGDKLGAWYVNKLRKESEIEVSAVGGNFLKAAGATLYDRLEKLNVVGLIEIIKNIKFLLRFLSDLTKHILDNNFDEVVVVDFPGFNLRLMKKIKKIKPEIKITYLSPPQLWAWGERRIKTIKKYCDEVIVLYPFEVEWYKKRGVYARWLGYPFLDKVSEFCGQNIEKKNHIAIMPGSRSIEIKRLLPLFLKVINRFKLLYPNVKIFLPLAESVDKEQVERILRKSGSSRWGKDITIVCGQKEKLKVLSSCCLALTKPGTVTLELALLSVPAVVAYKAPWITYFIAKLLVKIKYMALPNLLLKDPVYPEFIQSDCKEDKILKSLKSLYFPPGKNSANFEKAYQEVANGMLELKKELSQHGSI